MIVDVDRALMTLLRREVLGEAPIEVAFEVPNRPWTQAVKRPTINLFLYDLRENIQAREVMPEVIRDDKGRVVGRRPPARKFDLYYVMSVWGVPLAAEHQLLSGIVGGLSEHAVFPKEYLSEGLLETGHETFLSVADGMRRGMLPSFSGEMKLQIEVAVTACMPAKVVAPVGVPVRKGIELTTKAPGTEETVTPAVDRKGMVQVNTTPSPTPPPKAAGPSGTKHPQAGDSPPQPANAVQPARPFEPGEKPAEPRAKPPEAAPTTQAQAQALTDAAKAKEQQAVQQAVRQSAAAKPQPGQPGAPGAQAGGQPAKQPPPDPVARLAAALTQAAQVQAALAQTMAQCVAALGAATNPGGVPPPKAVPPATASPDKPAPQPKAAAAASTAAAPSTAPAADPAPRRAAKPAE